MLLLLFLLSSCVLLLLLALHLVRDRCCAVECEHVLVLWRKDVRRHIAFLADAFAVRLCVVRETLLVCREMLCCAAQRGEGDRRVLALAQITQPFVEAVLARNHPRLVRSQHRGNGFADVEVNGDDLEKVVVRERGRERLSVEVFAFVASDEFILQMIRFEIKFAVL